MKISSLKFKIFSSIFVVFIAICIIYLFIGKAFVFPIFVQIERQELITNLKRCQQAIDREISNLDIICGDWSSWSDTYAYVQNPYQDYEESNLIDETFTSYNLHMIMIINNENIVVWKKIFDTNFENEIELEAFTREKILQGHPALQLDNKAPLKSRNKAGIFLSENGPLLIASRPILTSSQEGPTMGTFIMGKFLSKRMIEQLKSQIHISFNLILPGETAHTGKFDAINEKIDKNGGVYIKKFKNELAVYACYLDLSSKPAFIIETRYPRNITTGGLNALRSSFFVLVISIVFILSLLHYFMKNSILYPIEKLRKFASNPSNYKHHKEQIPIGNSDEIGDLAQDMNKMAKIIGKQTQRLNNSKKELECLVEKRTAQLERSLDEIIKANNQIDGILKSLADGLIVTDNRNRVVLMNHAAEQMLGVRLSETAGRPFDLASQEKILCSNLGESVDRKQDRYQFDFKIPGGEPGRFRVMRARTSPLQNGREAESGLVTIIADVTHEREIDRMKTEFISTAAHELRTPVTSIKGFSEILMTRADIGSEEKNKFLAYINEQSDELTSIIDDILDITRIESGRGFALNKKAVAVGDIIHKSLSPFLDSVTACQFELNLPEKETVLDLDPDKMVQVMKNLLSNATKYSPEGGQIKVTGRVHGGRYLISVEDEGIGMLPEQIERVFDKFYRVDASNTSLEGSGLGMSIVKHIVEAHGGTVRVESQLGRGTAVCFSIPT